MIIDEVRCLLELLSLERPGAADHAIFHLVVVHHEHHQDALSGEGQELHLAQGGDLPARKRDHAGHTGDAGQQGRGRGHELLGTALRFQLVLNQRQGVRPQGLNLKSP